MAEVFTENGRLREEIKKLQRRIHNQRKANRETWEIVERRRKWLGTDTAHERAIYWKSKWREAIAAGASRDKKME